MAKVEVQYVKYVFIKTQQALNIQYITIIKNKTDVYKKEIKSIHFEIS